jgi:chromosomal replication initiation ATPase DnaA
LREIGDKLGGMDYAAVSIMLKRFENKASRDKMLSGKIKELKSKMLNVET